MAQTVVLTDETQTVTVVTVSDYPVLYSGEQFLKQAILRIGDLHAAEPIDTVAYAPDVAPYLNKITVTLLDARVVVYRLEVVDPDTELFVMEFTGGTWEETSLDLLNTLKNGILELNQAPGIPNRAQRIRFELDTLDWASI
jgi:hypothetical protein